MGFRETCVVLLLLQHTGGALEISVPSTHKTTVGSPVLIPCNYTVQKPPVNPKLFAAFWYLEGKQILSYDNEVRTTDPRYSLDIEKALNGRVDLSISNIALSDAGFYACSVLYSPLRKTKDITLYVTAPPQVTITGKTVVLNEQSVLRCSVTGFYPVDISIKWFRGREMLRDVTEGKPRRNSDGSYSVNSIVTITPTEEDREQNFSCRVQHESLKKPLQEDFQLLYRDENVMPENQSLHIAGVINIIIIISTVLVILATILIAVLYRNTLLKVPELSVGTAGEQIMPLMQNSASAATRPRQETAEERTTEEWRTEGGERPLPVNESIHEEKQKTSAELETDLLGERDNQDCTPVPKNGKSKGSCPAKEWSGEKGTEEPPSPTNKPCEEEETDHLEESSTREDGEEREQRNFISHQ